MKSLTILSLIPLAIALSSKTSHSPLFLQFSDTQTPKRAYETCEKTYGGGSIVCGDPKESHYCYDPSKGETCCPLDFGYCKAGDYCAAVEGFCCHIGEELGVCAQRLTFSIPATLAPATSTTKLLGTATEKKVVATVSILTATSATPAVTPLGKGVGLPSTSITSSRRPEGTISVGLKNGTGSGNGTVRVGDFKAGAGKVEGRGEWAAVLSLSMAVAIGLLL